MKNCEEPLSLIVVGEGRTSPHPYAPLLISLMFWKSSSLGGLIALTFPCSGIFGHLKKKNKKIKKTD